MENYDYSADLVGAANIHWFTDKEDIERRFRKILRDLGQSKRIPNSSQFIYLLRFNGRGSQLLIADLIQWNR